MKTTVEKIQNGRLYCDEYPQGVWVDQDIIDALDGKDITGKTVELDVLHTTEDNKYDKDTSVVVKITIGDKQNKMTETKQYTVEYVAKTGGLKFKETGDQWHNSANDAIKTQILNTVQKGQVVQVAYLDDKISEIAIVEGDIGKPTVTDATPNYSQSSSVPKKDHIITLQGKEYITFAGLLDHAHNSGLVSINTDLVENSDKISIVKASVTMKGNNVYTAYGDATLENTNKMIGIHKLRMAETRAVGRALRFATNIGMTALEELGDTKSDVEKAKEDDVI